MRLRTGPRSLAPARSKPNKKRTRITMTLPKLSVSEQLAAAFSGMPPTLPVAVAGICDAGLMDVARLCVAARKSDYLQAAVRATPGPRGCTLFGHAGGFNVATAALCHGTAAHGGGYD